MKKSQDNRGQNKSVVLKKGLRGNRTFTLLMLLAVTVLSACAV